MKTKLSIFIISFFILFTLFTDIVALSMIYGEISDGKSGVQVETSTGCATLGVTDDAGQEYIDRIIFLGESTTYGLQRYGVLSGGVMTDQVWTGARTVNGKPQTAGTLSLSPAIASVKIFYPDTQEALNISQAVKAKKPDILIITLGLNNGASYYSENQFKSCYRALLDSISEAFSSTKVILQSIFPVAKTCEIKAYTPSRIKLCNKWIRDLAEEYGLDYLNTAEALADEDGYLKPEYENGGDGIHLNSAGLNAVLHYIKTHKCSEV